MRPSTSILLFGLLAVLGGAGVHANDDREQLEVAGFPGIVREPVEIWSDGTRLAGDVLRPRRTEPGERLPALVLCHGWGGLKAHLNQSIGPRFADSGYVVLTFDYRGWGESDSRLVVTGAMPEPADDGTVTVEAVAVRQLVDPLDQQEDIDAALSFIEGERGVDPRRIGIWGSSFGGGHVVWRAAHDDRVAAVVAQVGAMDQRTGTLRSLGTETVRSNRIARARGELPPVPLGDDKPEGLTGSPFYERFVRFNPLDHTETITAPVLIIDAELEHYFDNREHGWAVYQRLLGQVPVEYHELKGAKHYDIYRGEHLEEAMALEIAFFDKHLKAR